MTPPPATVQFLPAEPVMTELAALRELLERTLRATADSKHNTPLYLPLTKLGRLFGMERKSVAKHVTLARCNRAIRCMTPDLEDGSRCLTLYCVEDFAAWLGRRSADAPKGALL